VEGQRFVNLLGVPPMQYLAQRRLHLAAQQLRLADRPLAPVVEDVDYQSEAAFNRAFKREFGVHQQHGAGTPPVPRLSI
jgi:AraC-like DNA-binding protein